LQQPLSLISPAFSARHKDVAGSQTISSALATTILARVISEKNTLPLRISSMKSLGRRHSAGRARPASLHVATALVVSLLGELTVKLAGFHFATALIHRLAGYPAGRLLPRAKGARHKQRYSETGTEY
jgi:hypothetical protein